MPTHPSQGSRNCSRWRASTTSRLLAILVGCSLSCIGGCFRRPPKVVTDILFLDQKLTEHTITHNLTCPGGLVDLTVPDSKGHVTLPTLPLDPWGRSYVYRSTGKLTYDIASWGADGTPGGTGDNQDVTLSMIRAGKY